jgi:hypothetical protein
MVQWFHAFLFPTGRKVYGQFLQYINFRRTKQNNRQAQRRRKKTAGAQVIETKGIREAT